MIGLEQLWGAVGFASGVVVAVIVMLVTLYLEER